jgi:POT family proton-dependent oligopeptide transporter
VQGIAFLYYWPTLLALVSRAAPAKVNATMMGVAFMSLFVSNILIGWVGGFYEKMRPIDFWAMHAAIAATGGVLVMLFGRRLSRALAMGGANQPLRPSALTLEVER